MPYFQEFPYLIFENHPANIPLDILRKTLNSDNPAIILNDDSALGIDQDLNRYFKTIRINKSNPRCNLFDLFYNIGSSKISQVGTVDESALIETVDNASLDHDLIQRINTFYSENSLSLAQIFKSVSVFYKVRYPFIRSYLKYIYIYEHVCLELLKLPRSFFIVDISSFPYNGSRRTTRYKV